MTADEIRDLRQAHIRLHAAERQRGYHARMRRRARRRRAGRAAVACAR